MIHKLKVVTQLTLVMGLALSTSMVIAAEGHNHDHGNKAADGHTMDGMSGDMFLKKLPIDGYDVSFHVMEAQAGMSHGGSHNLMIKVEQGNKLVESIKINSKVIHPNGKSESKMLMKMGDWFMAGYDLGHAGKHQLMILFKTDDGKSHKGGVYYP